MDVELLLKNQSQGEMDSVKSSEKHVFKVVVRRK